MWAIWDLIHCCWGAPQWAPAPKLIATTPNADLIGSTHIESHPRNQDVSTWRSCLEMIKCMNPLSSRWSYPDTARSSMRRKAQLHIWFIALRDSSGVFKVCIKACFLGPLEVFVWGPDVFSLASVNDPQLLSAAKPRVHSSMWNARGCEVTVGSHLTQKTGICQTFFHQQTTSPPQEMFLFQIKFDEDILGIRWIGYGH